MIDDSSFTERRFFIRNDCLVSDGRTICELERIWEEVVVANFKAVPEFAWND